MLNGYKESDLLHLAHAMLAFPKMFTKKEVLEVANELIECAHDHEEIEYIEEDGTHGVKPANATAAARVARLAARLMFDYEFAVTA